jgi:hypothetical protein
MPDPSSFLPISVLVWIEGICSQFCISRLVLATSDISGEMFDVDDTVFAGGTVLHNKRQKSDVIQNWNVSATRGRGETLTCFTRESWTSRCL